MNRELAITSQQFGFAAGIFFWGYFLFEVPSNLILHKIGARVWIARILITWGAVATLTGFVQSANQLYIARFALGLAEAGYFPGIVLYLGYWFRQREKAQAIALILMGLPLASILGAPISGFILDHVHLACIGFGHGFAAYTFSFWLPQIMKSVLGGQSNTVVGVLVMIPNLLGLFVMILVSRHSDHTLERRYHMAASGVLAGIAMLLLGAPHSAFFSVVLFSAVAMGAYSFLPVFFSMPGEFLTGSSAAAGIALVTSVANLGGFVGPYPVGIIRLQTGNLYYGLICAGVLFLLSASLALALPKRALPAPDQPSGAADVAFETGA